MITIDAESCPCCACCYLFLRLFFASLGWVLVSLQAPLADLFDNDDEHDDADAADGDNE